MDPRGADSKDTGLPSVPLKGEDFPNADDSKPQRTAYPSEDVSLPIIGAATPVQVCVTDAVTLRGPSAEEQ